jgi:hypothetical protein
MDGAAFEAPRPQRAAAFKVCSNGQTNRLLENGMTFKTISRLLTSATLCDSLVSGSNAAMPSPRRKRPATPPLTSRLTRAVAKPSAPWLPAMRQQLLNAAVHVRGQTLQHVLQIRPSVVPMELGRLQQTHHSSRALARQFTAGE